MLNDVFRSLEVQKLTSVSPSYSHISFCHFREGISKLKQVTGHEHRNIQHHIIGIIAGAAP
jgi:hypothetical protein